MSDPKVVRAEVIGDEYVPSDEDPYKWLVKTNEDIKVDAFVGPAYILPVTPEGVGPFEPWMVEWLKGCDLESQSGFFHQTTKAGKIAAAIASLFEEADDES